MIQFKNITSIKKEMEIAVPILILNVPDPNSIKKYYQIEINKEVVKLLNITPPCKITFLQVEKSIDTSIMRSNEIFITRDDGSPNNPILNKTLTINAKYFAKKLSELAGISKLENLTENLYFGVYSIKEYPEIFKLIQITKEMITILNSSQMITSFEEELSLKTQTIELDIEKINTEVKLILNK